ncbi:MAG: 2-C-methyl-D-erythritol 4-phosphate cytidylyltransferase [Phycisphaeraceae bacterium]|nr:MAG: 2-C-methyl-D-erythritol 4-phosphate cytidylyltransferase [Phycisphaeraceae bacterium]
MEIAVIIAAGGSSTRYASAGGVRAKLDEDLGGKPLLQRTMEAFANHDRVRWIVVAGPGSDPEFAEFKARHGDRIGLLGATLVRGGANARWESVKAALEAVDPGATHIAVHDAARPCVSEVLLDRVFGLAKEHPAVIPAVACADTVKRVERTDRPASTDEDPAAAILGLTPGDGERLSVVRATIEREGLMMVQTPQVFEAGLLRRAYGQADLSSTDDAGLVERLGVEVVVARGEAKNLKVTVPEDLAMVRAVMGFRGGGEKPAMRRF